MNTVKKKKKKTLRNAKNCKKSDSHLYKKKKIMIIFKLNSELRSQDNQIIINLRKRTA